MSVLVDSDILIEVSRGRDTAIVERWMALSRSVEAVLYTPVTAAELWAGARPGEQELLTRLFQAIDCAPLDEETGRMAGAFLRQFHKSHSVELGDALIAAAAVQQEAMLWTRNRKHYPMAGVRFY
ncbi:MULTISPECIES: type II toxin-antitoxin system VapC family toxin [Acidobacterium]|uniref:PIN domain protein n=1 Tax=Acidobacterium capsulatum (strain ATCC 51196 / DSM 11244 / BCRC 80197 / JCM 7670 / NBRC 15755 / NCIMB 13165 / 161) TaxID=240015 RepID=C1F795_ACIC5|nr:MULTISPECIES: type II toxin-antitoxin system VapC family toxin [Acidobacterium]ACO32612.1 PIN domain protein [Acidobacterium capsulatum ATCC 51196]HCT61028.1 type II toxin-antitoxin system VapC family toxin [Acidobacterium sp.]